MKIFVNYSRGGNMAKNWVLNFDFLIFEIRTILICTIFLVRKFFNPYKSFYSTKNSGLRTPKTLGHSRLTRANKGYSGSNDSSKT